MGRENGTYSAASIKKICLDAGADDVGLVDLERESLQEEREGILHVYSLTRSIIAVVTVNNRENIQSPARYVANEEFHHTGDKTSSVSSRDPSPPEPTRHSWGCREQGMAHGYGSISREDLGCKPQDHGGGGRLGHMGMNRLVLHPK